MISFENTKVMNFSGAFYGMRNPLNSWDMSDSDFRYEYEEQAYLGDNDLALAQKLIKAGSDHRKFMRQIFVSVDITAPLYWWKEFDTYKVGTVANSCSTMHKIHSKPIELDDFSRDWFITGDPIAVWDNGIISEMFDRVVADCEELRQAYLESKNKKYWKALIQLLPESYNQRRTVTLNYEVLRNIYGSRRNHKLDEWSVGFMEWIDSLPYAEELIKYN